MKTIRRGWALLIQFRCSFTSVSFPNQFKEFKLNTSNVPVIPPFYQRHGKGWRIGFAVMIVAVGEMFIISLPTLVASNPNQQADLIGTMLFIAVFLGLWTHFFKEWVEDMATDPEYRSRNPSGEHMTLLVSYLTGFFAVACSVLLPIPSFLGMTETVTRVLGMTLITMGVYALGQVMKAIYRRGVEHGRQANG